MTPAKLTPLVSITVMIVIGVAYLTFLSMTWRQLQDDRIVRNLRVDDLIDRFPKPHEPSGEPDADRMA